MASRPGGDAGEAGGGAGGGAGEPYEDDFEMVDDATLVQELIEMLTVQMSRVIDLFRNWDEDGNGTVSKLEFRRALPMLGIKVRPRLRMRPCLSRRRSLTRAAVSPHGPCTGRALHRREAL